MPRRDDSGGGSGGNQAWNLEAFLDALVLELDKAQNTLALKAVNRKLTYTVKDLGLDLHIFPSYDGDAVKFRTATPGQQGASKLSIQLGSITDTLIREVTRQPEGDDVSIEAVDVDPETRSTLNKLGIHTSKDLDRIRQRRIDVGAVAGKSLDYSVLADRINQARRRKSAPSVRSVSMSIERGEAVLRVRGDNLAPIARAAGFPVAQLDRQHVRVAAVSPEELCITVEAAKLREASHELRVALDPFAVLRMRLAGADNHEVNDERETA